MNMVAKTKINILLLFLATAVFLDGATTFYAFDIGLHEGNPIAVAISPAASLLIRTVIIAYLFVRYERKEPIKKMKLLLLLAIVWTGIVVLNNVSLIIYVLTQAR